MTFCIKNTNKLAETVSVVSGVKRKHSLNNSSLVNNKYLHLFMPWRKECQKNMTLIVGNLKLLALKDIPEWSRGL